jgi:hypothetical protein
MGQIGAGVGFLTEAKGQRAEGRGQEAKVIEQVTDEEGRNNDSGEAEESGSSDDGMRVGRISGEW